MNIHVNRSKSKTSLESLQGKIDNKSKFATELYSLYLNILFLSLVIIMYQISDHSVFPVQNVYGSTTSYDRNVSAGQQVTINAAKTSSSAGGPIDFTWTQISGIPVLNGTTAKGPVLSFKAPISKEPQILEFKLVASRGQLTKSATVNVLVRGDEPPNAKAGRDVIVKAQEICGENTTNSISSFQPPQQQITLDASNSTDREGGPLKYRWTQIEGPPITISNPNNVTITINKDSICKLTQTTYLEFRLNATDKVGQTGSDTVTVPVILGEDLISFS